MSVNPVSPVTFNGGQMTDLPEFSGTLDGTELIEIVAAGAGQNLATEGVNYSIPSNLLATLLFAVGFAPTIVETGATIGDPFEPTAIMSRVLINKTVPSNSYIDLGGAVDRNDLPVMVRDIANNADTYPISVAFTGTCDGMASPIIINSANAGYIFNPLPNGNWYLSNA